MIIPCIDLQDGKVVQLVRGHKKAIEIDSVDDVLERFRDFPLIHAIDLDAAKGKGSNLELIEKIVRERPARVGGGVRDLARARELIDLGATQVIVGTAAFEGSWINEPLLRSLRDDLGVERICIALDCKEGSVVVRGWQEALPICSEDALVRLTPYCTSFLCTFVDNEGTLEGTDLPWYERLRRLTTHKLIAAGGVCSIEEIRSLAALGLDVALGMAVYTGKLDLAVLAELNDRPIRPHVHRMTAYVSGPTPDGVIRLDSNENALGPSPKAIAAVKTAAEQMHRYPDSTGGQLKAKLAEKSGLKAENIVLGNGSDELIHLLGLITLGPGDELLIGEPTFVRYAAAGFLADARVVAVPLTQDYRYDLATMAQLANARTRLVFLANPNSPSGTIIRKPEFDAFLEALPKSALVVLDEAYFEFAEGDPALPVSTDYVSAGVHLVGLRTFSKAYGLAGIRLGYGFAPEWVVEAIEKVREPFNVNALAQAAGLAALGDAEHLSNTVRQAKEGRKELEAMLLACGAKTADSHANFVFAEFPYEVSALKTRLAAEGILVRGVASKPSCLRVTVGLSAQHHALAKAIQAMTGG